MPTHIMYQVDAFAERLFAGNPAAVMLFDDAWPDDSLLAAIAMENNLAETAFARRRADGAGFDLRWFTPVHEVAFCGHATLATAHVLASAYGATGTLAFHTRDVGILHVVRCANDRYELDIPCLPPQPLDPVPDDVERLFPSGVRAAFRNFENLFVELPDELAVRGYDPDLLRIAGFFPLGFAITARADAGSPYDFVSRYFAPGAGIPEDPVTGSTHATLVPYWASAPGKSELAAVQASKRGGHLSCRLDGDRVRLAGAAVTFMKAEIYLPD